MSGALALSGRLVGTGQGIRAEVRSGRVASIEPVASAPERWIAPGFVDIQVNGYSGWDVNAADPSPGTIEGLAEALWQVGVTRFCPTVVTGPQDHTLRCLEAIADATTRSSALGRSVLCAHLEGPAISAEDGPRGAHPLEHVRPVDEAEYSRWRAAAQGRLGIITLAPETPGAIDFIRRREAEGVVMAIGHTAASPAQVREAVDAGARLSTHLGNGSHAVLDRLDNYVWEQMADDRLCASLVFDGHHLPPAVMKVMVRAKGPGRALLVSDSVALAGGPSGQYQSSVGSEVEVDASGRVGLSGTPFLAGSSANLLAGVSNGMALGGLDLATCVRMASVNPAKLLRLPHRPTGPALRVGMAADLTVFSLNADGQPTVELTVVGGDPVYKGAS